jgi:signal transduction histidine kinase/DNA-binding response OmpR family regulator/ligand-binding sensor domain-containing protein
MIRRFLFVGRILLFFFPILILGQQIKHLGLYDGIRSGAVRAFEKDTLGYMWIGTSQGLNRYSGYQFKNYDKFLTSGVADIISKNGDLFVLGTKGELLQYNYQQDSFKSILNFKDTKFLSFELINHHTIIIGLQQGLLIYDLASKSVSKILHSKSRFNRRIQIHKNQIYIASTKGIDVYDYYQSTHQLIKQKSLLKNHEILDLDFDNQNRIWAGTYQKGLFVIDEDEVTTKIKIYDNLLKTHTIRSIEFDKDNKALIALEGFGLLIIDPLFKTLKKVEYTPNEMNSLSQNSIYKIFVDEENVYWLGLREVGIDVIYPRDNAFKNIFYIPFKPNSISNNNIRSIYFEDGGNVWFGTENGISKQSLNGNWTNYNTNSKLKNKAVLTIDKFGEHLLLGVYGSGLIKFNPKTGETSNFELKEKGLKSKRIFTTFLDNNELWVGGFDGPLKHYTNNVLVNTYKIGNARCIVAGEAHTMYVASSSGIYEINKLKKSVHIIKDGNKNYIDQNHAVLFDKQNNCLWIGNTQGLYSFNLSTKKIKQLNTLLNFESGTVFSIQKDSKENLWFSSYAGLWKLNIKKEIIRKYDNLDGLSIGTFGFGASTYSTDGRLAFGGPDGATLFDPLNIPIEKEVSKIYISNFQINGVLADTTIIEKNINYLDKIELNYNQNSLSFDFEAPTFHGSKKHSFNWQLKGHDETINKSKNSRSIVYSKLPPGNYSLDIEATNIEDVSSIKPYHIDIIIKNPFWLSHLAFLIYALIGSTLLYLSFLIRKSRAAQKFNDNKIKFFTEVAHDIRTPVTLIQLLVSQLSEKNNLKNNIDLIHRNTQNLNEYVTQLLDFQKADRGMLKLSIIKVDVKEIIHRIVAEVEPLLHKKSIDIIISVPKNYVWIDENKISRIFYNLISNAIKYSEDGGQIEIKAVKNKSNLSIKFIDNGLGIPKKEQQLIFSRFTRGTNINNKGISGSGIGLMISKKIIELHKGTIEFNSKENLGSTFTITLKMGSEHYEDKDILIESSNLQEPILFKESLSNRKRILLVEDNEDLRATIKLELENKYTVLDAPNGKEALLIALAKNIDLIITDVMMPEMGGKELCHVIKSNFQTSHIPVIMMTALSDLDTKIEGLETGADAYLEKPFNMKILIAMANNLINSRETIHQILSSKSQDKVTPKSADENFLSEVVEIIKNNITNSEFSIKLISDKTGLSRSNLFRKLKGLTNMSPVDLVIKIKLNHASELLKAQKFQRISEVAYESGFNNPKYFSTLFKKHFGKTPKEYSEEN